MTDLQNIDALVALYGYYKNESPPKKGLYEDLQELFDKQYKESRNVACEAVGELKRFANHYAEDIYGKEDRVFYSLCYLRWHMLWKSVLLTALAENHQEVDGLARILRRFYYLHWIASKTLASVKPITFEVIKAVKRRESLDEIRKILEKKICNSEDNIVEQAIDNLRADSIAKDAWCKPLLMMMEYGATDDAKDTFVVLDQKVHLEHVLPVEHRGHKDWSHINVPIADKYLNSGGNLTLLSGKKNIAASNKPFHIKMNAYKGRGLHGNEAGVTAFVITKKIVEDYHRGKYDKQWNEEAMRDRKKWFLEQAAKILDIKIPAEKD